jgi:hypothetical protein
MPAPFRLPRTRQGAATLRLAASSVAPVASSYERSVSRSGVGRAAASALGPAPSSLRRQRPCEPGVSRLASMIQTKGDR